MGMMEFRLMLLPYFLLGAMNVLGSAVRGLGHSTAAMIVSLVGVCGFRMVWIGTIFQIPQFHTMEMLILSYPITWAVTSLAQFSVWVYAVRKLKRRAELTAA